MSTATPHRPSPCLTFDTVSVAQGIERVLAGGGVWRDVADHNQARVGALERVPQHLGELGTAEWDVALVHVQRTDALLQSQQGFVDLRTLQPRLPGGQGWLPSCTWRGWAGEARRPGSVVIIVLLRNAV